MIDNRLKYLQSLLNKIEFGLEEAEYYGMQTYYLKKLRRHCELLIYNEVKYGN